MTQQKSIWPLIIILLVVGLGGLGFWLWWRSRKQQEPEQIPAQTPTQPISYTPPVQTTQPVYTPTPTPDPVSPPAPQVITGAITRIAFPEKAAEGADLNFLIEYQVSAPNANVFSSVLTIEGNGQYKYNKTGEWGAEASGQWSPKLVMPGRNFSVEIRLLGHPDYSAKWSSETSGWQLLAHVTRTIALVAPTTPTSVITPTSPDPYTTPSPPAITAAITTVAIEDAWWGKKKIVMSYQGTNPSAKYWATMVHVTGPGVYREEKTRELGAGAGHTLNIEIGKPGSGDRFAVELYVCDDAAASMSDLSKWTLKDKREVTYSG